MTEYDEHISRLETQIYGKKVLRDAQRVDSARWDRFQQDIDGLTDEMTEWMDATPELVELDDAIVVAERRLKAADQAAEDAQVSWSIAKFLGVVGIVCLLISVTWMPSIWFPVLTFVFLAGAVAAIMAGTRGRQARSEAVDVAESDLYSLQERRRHRMPERTVTRSVARSIPAVGRVLVGPEMEDAGDD
jgi:hypothetical protein